MVENKKIIVLHDFKKFWIRDTAQGSVITLCYGLKDQVMEIDCRWKNRKRDAGGRVINAKK